VISPPSNTSIWIAAGITDMRRGFTGLSAAAQTVLEQNPFRATCSFSEASAAIW
jgi:transposase